MTEGFSINILPLFMYITQTLPITFTFKWFYTDKAFYNK